MSIHGVPAVAQAGWMVQALRAGWADFCRLPRVSMGFAAAFLVVGALLARALVALGLAPLVLPLVGAFMLFGPVTLCGFLGVREAHRRGHDTPPGLPLKAMAAAPRPVWVLGAFCTFMALVWLTDAGTLYSFMVGRWHDGWAAAVPTDAVAWRFHAGSGVAGGFLALIVFAVTVHGIPLAVRGEGTLVTAVVASVRAIGRAPLVHLMWAMVLAVAVLGAVLVPPALLVVLPVMAYASAHWTERVFPPVSR
ncbi:DUF2189 domain-containing protein [Nitrogeniibacter mangrovi]|uniref:DUF2189 domain-containing protein n=1 Tax=Nitrogeniibacter mangrovi TaxID=2016596 RepID=A0A6C1B247_9RHOO|nr:DUF2189 domain-containing protein [Nitrogeniibacter mangrovi]QID17059.1 DUF2189 domain-containing protein [Nitrogeniibacter mangrovi]